MISSARIHLWLALLFCRDYFFHPDSSLACSFVLQGLFLPPGFISGLLFCSTGIISSFRIHPWLALFHHRDDFFLPNSSLNDRFCVQGCILPTKCIPDELFFRTEIITCLIAEKNQKNLVFSTFTTVFVESTRFLKRCRQRESNPHSVARTGF